MMSSLTTKLALRKLGLSSKDLDFSSPAPEQPKKGGKNAPLEEESTNSSGWPAWMTVKSLPLTMQPWLAPPPPPVPVAAPPKVGDLAPLDRDRQLDFGGGRSVLVVFLRCVGCAFAQKTFLALRAISAKYQGRLTCIAVSHSSPAATAKWLDLIGGKWQVQVIIDEDRALYAAWGLGLSSVWHVFNPTSQIAGFKDKGWLGARVAESIQRTGTFRKEQQERKAGGAAVGPGPAGAGMGPGASSGSMGAAGANEGEADAGPLTTLGNKWQESGAWAIDGRGTIVWGGKALRADEVMDFEAAAKALRL